MEVEAEEVEATEVPAAEVEATEVEAAEVEAVEVETTEEAAAEVQATEVPAAEMEATVVPAVEVEAKTICPIVHIPVGRIFWKLLGHCLIPAFIEKKKNKQCNDLYEIITERRTEGPTD